MRKTVAWYLAHRDWCERVASEAHRRRLGLGAG
jgi:dTDP-D-glucose 4,6-dehydratase